MSESLTQNYLVNTNERPAAAAAVVVAEISSIPESYRPLILICFGLYGWIAVLVLLKRQHINVNMLLSIHATTNHLGPLCMFALILTLMITCHIFLLEHTLFTQHTNLFNHFGPVVLCYSLALSLALLGPCRKESRRLFKCLYKLLFRLRYGQTYFSEVLVADILISFSGVLTGIFIKLMQVAQIEYMQYVPFVTSIPFLIRLKQCLNDYFAQPSQYRSKRQLVNAIKYASTLPAIFLQHAKPNTDNLMRELSVEEMILWRLWFLLALGSSMFAFGWDLVMDWGLVEMDIDRSFSDTLLLKLRKDRHFSDPLWYVAAASANGCLRALKIGSHVYHVHPFCVDLGEIFRRWIWVIFRFENEWIKRYYVDVERDGIITEETQGNSSTMFGKTGSMLHIPPMASNRIIHIGSPEA